MYQKNPHETLVAKCPACGKFVSFEDGWYGPEDPEDETSDIVAYCSVGCYRKVVLQRKAENCAKP